MTVEAHLQWLQGGDGHARRQLTDGDSLVRGEACSRGENEAPFAAEVLPVTWRWHEWLVAGHGKGILSKGRYVAWMRQAGRGRSDPTG